MVTRILLLLGVFLAVLAVACGGSNSPSASSTTTGAPSISPPPTSTPTGAYAIVEPKDGPPGTEITVTGKNWGPGASIDVTGTVDAGASGSPYKTTVSDTPYKTVVSGSDGSFSVQFRLEKKADGSDLTTGLYDLIVHSATTQVTVPFLVGTRHPITGTGPTS